jgi:membrane protein DedA with SNARE-associated domain
MRWLGIRKLDRVEHWFDRWGDKAIILSRWLTGVRALLAVMAGIGRMNAGKMLLYSLISAVTFNIALLFLALRLRKDWTKIEGILTTYNTIIIAVVLVVAGIVVYRVFIKRRRSTEQ